MTTRRVLLAAGVCHIGHAGALVFGARTQAPKQVVLTNVSHDPTRDLYRAPGESFAKG
jgi:ABC-type sulfate transport system substrate-binding protein